MLTVFSKTTSSRRFFRDNHLTSRSHRLRDRRASSLQGGARKAMLMMLVCPLRSNCMIVRPITRPSCFNRMDSRELCGSKVLSPSFIFDGHIGIFIFASQANRNLRRLRCSVKRFFDWLSSSLTSPYVAPPLMFESPSNPGHPFSLVDRLACFMKL